MVLSVLDGSTLRTPHNIYVLDGSTVRRVRQIRALDGSTLRHPFTKTDFFDFSGTANTLNPAVAEVYQYTVSGATNSGTQTVYTGYQQSNTGTTNQTNSYNWYFGAGNPGSTNGQNSSGVANSDLGTVNLMGLSVYGSMYVATGFETFLGWEFMDISGGDFNALADFNLNCFTIINYFHYCSCQSTRCNNFITSTNCREHFLMLFSPLLLRPY